MSTVISVIAVGILIAFHELGHFAAARRMGMKVLRFSIGFFHPIVSWQSKQSGVIYQVGAVPLGGFVQISGMNPFEEGVAEDKDAFINKPVWKRAVVLVAGPGANLLLAWVILFGLFASSGIPEPVDKPIVGIVYPGTPSLRAGLRVGDTIEKLDGESLVTWQDLVKRLQVHPGKEVVLDVRRGEQHLVIKITPDNMKGVGKIGIGQSRSAVAISVHAAALGAFTKCFQVVGENLTGLAKLITGKGDDVEAVGPLGIVKMAAATLDISFVDFLGLIANLNLILFLFNLMPLPALDGGRGLFLLYEAVSRRRVHPKVDVAVNTAGFFLLIGLLLFVTVKEIFGI